MMNPLNSTPASREYTWRDWLGHVSARVGIARMSRAFTPGLYHMGNPDPQSPVLVTANYTLTLVFYFVP